MGLVRDCGNPLKPLSENKFRNVTKDLAKRCNMSNPEKCTPHAGRRYGVTKMAKKGICEGQRLEASRHRSLDIQCDYQEGDVNLNDKYYESMAVVPLPKNQVCI